MTSFQGMWKIIVGGKEHNMKSCAWFEISKGHTHTWEVLNS